MLPLAWLAGLLFAAATPLPRQAVPAGFDFTLTFQGMTLQYPGADFGLALAGQELPSGPSLPVCAKGFDDCLYYRGTPPGGGFEGAALRVQARKDLANGFACQNGRPAGFSGDRPVGKLGPDFASSLFANYDSGEAGHAARSTLWRLRYQNICYEFEARVVGNPSDHVAQELDAVMGTLTLPGGEQGVLPPAASVVFRSFRPPFGAAASRGW